MRAHEIMDMDELLDLDARLGVGDQTVEEDRWSEVEARKPVPPKATPIARAMRPKKRKPAPNNFGGRASGGRASSGGRAPTP